MWNVADMQNIYIKVLLRGLIQTSYEILRTYVNLYKNDDIITIYSQFNTTKYIYRSKKEINFVGFVFNCQWDVRHYVCSTFTDLKTWKQLFFTWINILYENSDIDDSLAETNTHIFFNEIYKH